MNKKTVIQEETPIRLNKFLSMCGITSRRKAEEMILNKRIAVNGEIITKLGTKVFASSDRVTLDKKTIKNKQENIYLMLNKPRGCLCTLKDDKNRPTVIDLLRLKTKIFPIGRLDFNTEGLLLLTNDGEFAQQLSHPRKKIPKIYLVKVAGIPNSRTLLRMKKGVSVDGVCFTFSDVIVHRTTGKNSWLRVTLHEGKNRQIRKVCERCGHMVIKLNRIEYGGVSLGKLLPREWRSLTFDEFRILKKATGIKRTKRPLGETKN